MRNGGALGVALAVLLTVAACGGASSTSRAETSASSGPSASSSVSTASAAPSPGPAGCVVGPQSPPPASIGASFPTALRFAPDGRLFWTERSGTLKVWQDGSAHTFASVSTVTTEAGGGYSERGLLGLALSPSFAADHLVYAFYSDADRSHQHVVRLTDCGGVGRDPRVILTLPSGNDCCHKGGRLAFGPDGKLYVGLGEEHSASAAQDRSDPRGKILRYNPDGSIPTDNPFGAADPVYAYGLRNPFGITFSATGQLAVTNNGPSGDAGSPGTGYDTVVLAVVRGGGYGWPTCYGYAHPLAGSACAASQAQPDWSSESATVVPTGDAFVDASGPPQEAGHLVFCTFNRGMLILTPGTPHASVTQGPSSCRLDVTQGPDHALWVADNSRIVRIG